MKKQKRESVGEKRNRCPHVYGAFNNMQTQLYQVQPTPLSQPIPLGDIFLEQQTLMPQTRGHVPTCARHLHYSLSPLSPSLSLSSPVYHHHHPFTLYINYYLPRHCSCNVNPRIFPLSIHMMHHDIANQNHIHPSTQMNNNELFACMYILRVVLWRTQFTTHICCTLCKAY